MLSRRFTGAVLALLVPAALAAQRPMTADDVIGLKQVSDAQISPDGHWVAYVVSVVDPAQNAVNSDIYLVSADCPAVCTPIRLTSSPKADGQPRWSPDGRWIAFVSARDERAQIWLIRPTGGEAEKLSDSKTAVQSIQWSPDGKRIAFLAPRPATAEEEKKEKAKDDAIVVDLDFRMARLSVIDVQTRKVTDLAGGDIQINEARWSPDGARLAYSASPTPKADDGARSDIFVVAAEGGPSRKLVENPGPDAGPRWSPDGRWIAFLTRPDSLRSIGQQRLAVIAAEGGTPRVVIAPGFLYQPGPATWTADGKTLYFTASVRTTSQLYSVPAAGGEPVQISKTRGVMSAPTFADDGRTIAFTQATVQQPNEVQVARLGDGFAPRRLTNHNPELASIGIGRSDVIRWKSKDGTEVEGLVVYPVGYDPGKRYPTMAFIHGGPAGNWTETFPGNWGNFAHVWAGQGWVSFFPNVRGSTGYGEKFLFANIRDWGGGDYQDIQSGLDHLIRTGVADSTRLGQSGWSYGGYMTAWTLTQTNRFKGVMVGAGLTNMYSMYSTNDLQSLLEQYFGGEPWNDEQSFRRASAMMNIKKARTPTMIMHGQQDTRVPIGQAQELYMGLKKNNVPVTLVFFPREGHGLGEPHHQIDKMKREYAFFSKTVLGIEVKEKQELVP